MTSVPSWWGYGAFFATFALFAVLRAPFMARAVSTKVREKREGPLEQAIQALTALGVLGAPLVAATGLLRFADQPLWAWRVPAGAAVMAVAAALFYRSHADLGSNWSTTLTVRKEHTLVTSGVYARIRHPMYSSMVLLSLGQILAVPNWIGGLAGPLAVALFLPARVGREERLMLDTFGDAYRAYSARTGRLFPK
ncbi:MAG TPA: protein-S-isoprenylcysteine O-methyltransferase [Myxococcaceae bacterium]|nr:protein-S-isoprenylcysteine O-methyltransferase [Myxococcaceae bacterium]